MITGCADFANTRNMTAVGTILGAGAGVAIGAATGHIGEGAMIGAPAGALLGGYMGSKAENYSRRKTERELLKGVEQDIRSGTVAAPEQQAGQVETVKRSKWVDTSQKKRVWVEEKVVDGKVIEAHFEERLIPSGYWTEVEEKVAATNAPRRAAGTQ